VREVQDKDLVLRDLISEACKKAGVTIVATGGNPYRVTPGLSLAMAMRDIRNNGTQRE